MLPGPLQWIVGAVEPFEESCLNLFRDRLMVDLEVCSVLMLQACVGFIGGVVSLACGFVGVCGFVGLYKCNRLQST